MGFVVVGATCGMRRATTEGECASSGSCASDGACVAYVHPMASPFAVAALAGIVAVAFGWSLAALAVGIIVAAVGTVFGFSMGHFGVVPAWLLAAAGALRLRDRALAGTGIAAALLPLPLAILLVSAGGAHLAFYAAAFGPALAWGAFAAAKGFKPPAPARPQR